VDYGRRFINYCGGGNVDPPVEEGIEELAQFRKWVGGKIIP
jgi:hypothetical protein